MIRSNGIPDHATGAFPNAHNPNRVSAREYFFRVPVAPHAAAKFTPLGMIPFGVAVNGVVFDPSAAEWWRRDPGSGWQYEAMTGAINLGIDASHAHVQPDGAYHYHGVPVALLQRLGGDGSKMVLVGWAADGFPIYGPWGYRVADDAASGIKPMKSSYRVKMGTRPDGPGGSYDGSFTRDFEYIAGLGDLDQCNGRLGVTPEFPHGTYYYVLTNEFPFIPRVFRGTPDSSFFRRPLPAGFRGRIPPGGPLPPPPANR